MILIGRIVGVCWWKLKYCSLFMNKRKKQQNKQARKTIVINLVVFFKSSYSDEILL